MTSATWIFSMCTAALVLVNLGCTSAPPELTSTDPDHTENVGTTMSALATCANGSFESPNLGHGAYRYQPAGATWTFVGGAGISNTDSGFTSGAPEVPDGLQVGFIQNTGSMQQVSNLQPGSVLTFNATQRVNYGSPTQSLQVLVNGVPQSFKMGGDSGRVSVTSVTPPNGYYASYAVLLSSVITAGWYTIQIVGNNTTGDATAFLDAVTISTPLSHAYGVWDPTIRHATWRSDQPTSTNVTQVGICRPGTEMYCKTYPSSYPNSNWTHSADYVAGSPHWMLSVNDEPANSYNCASGPPNQSLPVTAPGTPGANFAVSALTTQSDPAIGNYNVVSLIYNAQGGTYQNSGCIPFLGYGADYKHGNSIPVAVMDAAGHYRPHLKFSESVFASDSTSLACARVVFLLAGWGDGIERHLELDLACKNYKESPERNLFYNFPWPLKNSAYYPGQPVTYWDVTYANSICGMNMPSVSFVNTYTGSHHSPSSISNYDIDLYHLFSCIASNYGWNGGTTLPDPLVVSHVEWVLETQENAATPPHNWIGVWNISVQ